MATKINSTTLYNESDIETLKRNSANIKNQIEKIKSQTSEPSQIDLQNAHDIIIKYCIDKKRKLYGGLALHLLLISKDPSLGIYINKIPDIDIYTPYPIEDSMSISNELFKAGHKYITCTEAVHNGTYTIKYYNETLCDFSYVSKNIYSRTPYIDVDGILCTHPNFMSIDKLRVLTDPITSWDWRIFESTDYKDFKRFVQMQQLYPLQYRNIDLNTESNTTIEQESVLNAFIRDRKTIVMIGFYVYNHYCKITGYEMIKIPHFEFISIDYKNDTLSLFNILKKQFNDVRYEEYYPFFQFTDYSTNIYINNKLICRIYNNNKRCTQYLDTQPLDNRGGTVRIGSFSLVIMYFLIDAQKNRVNKNDKGEQLYHTAVSHCSKMKNDYLRKYNLTFMDNTIFKEFIIDCIGISESMEKQKMLRIEDRKLHNKKHNKKNPLVFRYSPEDEYKEEPKKKYSFPNTSGNIVNNPKNYQLTDEYKNTNDNEIDTTMIKTTIATINSIIQKKSKYIQIENSQNVTINDTVMWTISQLNDDNNANNNDNNANNNDNDITLEGGNTNDNVITKIVSIMKFDTIERAKLLIPQLILLLDNEQNEIITIVEVDSIELIDPIDPIDSIE